MKSGDMFLQELKDKEEAKLSKCKALARLITACRLPRYEPHYLECVQYYREHRN